MQTTKRGPSGVILLKVGETWINSGTADRGEARRIAAMAIKLAPLIRDLRPDTSPLLRDVVAQWRQWLSTWASPRTQIYQPAMVARWADRFSLWDRPIATLTSEEIDRWINGPDLGKAGNRKINRSAIRSLFRWATTSKLADRDISALLRVRLDNLTHEQRSVRERVPFTDQEIDSIKRTIEERYAHYQALLRRPDHYGTRIPTQKVRHLEFWRFAVVVGLHTGLRLGDLAQMQWRSIKPGILEVWTGKRDRLVRLPINQEIQSAISMVPRRNDTFLFPEVASRKMEKDSGLSGQFAELLKRAGVRGHSFHDFRVTYATRAAAAGASTPHIAARLGHRGTEVTTTVYVKDPVVDGVGQEVDRPGPQTCPAALSGPQ